MMVRCFQTSAGGREIDKQTIITSPLLRCSALLLPIILMNVSSSVPNLPSPAVYKSCGNRYKHIETRCVVIRTHRPGIVPKQRRKPLFFLKLALLLQRSSGFWAPLLCTILICHVQIKTKTNYRLLILKIYHHEWFIRHGMFHIFCDSFFLLITLHPWPST